MSHPSHPFVINKLTLSDIPAAVSIETAAYTNAVPRRNFRHELEHNRLAHYLSLRVVLSQPQRERLIGVVGYWLIGNEAHIITIAILPRWQRMALGEWILLNMLEDCQQYGAEIATLEVRPSNAAALGLYQKFGFQKVGHRPGYYSDTGEDAFIFTTPQLRSAEYQSLLSTFKGKLWLRLAQINTARIALIN
jgi:ribosomal-protein-alanine N-acetyltransferase